MTCKSPFLFFIFLSLNASAATPFPERCEGTWQGTMYINAHGLVVDSVQIKLTVARLPDTLAAWSWKTEYLSEKTPVVKDYVLREKDRRSGVYLMDEGDGTELVSYVSGNILYSAFRVKKTLLTAVYELRENILAFTVTSGRRLKGKKSNVSSYSYDVVQRVEFRKTD